MRDYHHGEFKNPTYRFAIHNEDGPELADETPLQKVYFVLDAEACAIKIGITTNVKQRVWELNAQRGRKLDLLGTMAGGKYLEKAMHVRFADYRVEGREWFSTEIIPVVASLLAA